MPNNVITGNSFVDKIRPYIPNPEYNPKTKKGRVQPPILVDSSAPAINDNFMSRTMNSVNRLTFTGRELGFTNEEIESDADLGITLSPYNTVDELNKARADSQSALSQFGNFLAQAGLGEVLVGTMEGFGNIFDGAKQFVTGDNYESSAWTRFWEDIHNDIKDKFKIYRENPNADWDLSDFGWWMDNAVSVATTASLMIPAAGWARGISMLGRIGKIGKGINAVTRWASKGLSNWSKAARTGNKYAQIRAAASINKTINNAAEITGTALLSRTGENYMEGRQVYDEVYTNSKENLDNMPDTEFQKFLARHPEFRNQSKDDIAKEIARQSANETFYNDYWMLLMDIPQFKALGSLWGKPMQRASKASERIAAENVRRTLAGKKAEDLIKNNLLNRTKEGFKYAFKHPTKSAVITQLGEGFEEMYQGIQSEKGMEVATKYFDPSFTPRSLTSYFTDGSIWEQGFWGWIGGMAFTPAGQAIQKGSHAIKGLYNKKHMTAEEYEQWQRANRNIGAEKINNVTITAKEFIDNMNKINEGKNPFNFVVNKDTGTKIIKDGQLVEETIDDEQKELLKQEAIDKFVTDTAFDAIDSGVYPLMQEILNSSEFDQYLTKNGATVNGNDKAISKEISNRMEAISDMYQNELRNVNNLTDKANPFATIAAARSLVRTKLQLEDYENQLGNIAARMEEANDNQTDFNPYIERRKYNYAKRQLDNIERQEQIIATQYANKEIGASARDQYMKELDAQRKVWQDYIMNNTSKGAIEETMRTIQEDESIPDNMKKDFYTIMRNLDKQIASATEVSIPSDTIKELIDEEITIESRRNYTQAQLPLDEADYKNVYNEFAMAMDQMYRKRIDGDIDTVKNYLNNAKDLDEAINNVLSENTGISKVDNALKSIRYGYFNQNKDMRGQITNNLQMELIIEEARKNRKKAENLQAEAEQSGTVLPESEAGQQQEQEEAAINQQETQDENGNPSTGEVEQTTTANTDTTIATDNTNLERAESQQAQATVGAPEQEVETRQTGHEHDVNPMQVDVAQDEAEVQRKLAQTIDANSLRAELAARKYVMQIGFKEGAKLDAITQALQNKDESKLAEFIQEITDFLTKQGFDDDISKIMAQRALVSTINMYGAMNEKSAFGRLATQLAIGLNEAAAKKYSATELINGKGLDEVVDAFMEEFVKVTNNLKLSNGKYIINLKTLFNYLIHNESIDGKTAVQIYNNLNEYIASSVNTKYIFTGYDTKRGLYQTGEEFIHQVEEQRKQEISSRNQMHIHLIEPEQRNKEFNDAMLAAANGAPSHIEEQRNKAGELTNLNVIVDWEKNGKKKSTKIGILRTVHYSQDARKIYPNSHYSGFRNEITRNDDGTVSLDCDNLFYAICDATTTDGFNLRNAIADYFEKRLALLQDESLTPAGLNKALNALITPEFISSIVDNPLIEELINQGRYKPYVEAEDIEDIHDDEKSMRRLTAIRLAEDISKVLFYADGYAENNVASEVNDFAVDSYTLRERYKTWKDKVYDNYTHTYELQKAINNNENKSATINVNVGFVTRLNEAPEDSQPNIADQDFNPIPNTDGYTPFVYYSNGKLVDEYGNDYGYAPSGFGDYSMGFIVHTDGVQSFIAACRTTANVKNTKMHKAVIAEVADIITAQINNINNSNHADNFNVVKERLEELFGLGGLFYFGNINLVTDSNERFITIQYKQGRGKDAKYTNITTFHSINKDGITPSNAITIYDNAGKVLTNITSINAETQGILNKLTQTLTDNFVINRSQIGMTKQTKSGGTPRIFTWNGENFIVHLGAKDYTYKNYGDFIFQTAGFTTNLVSKNGSFVTRYIDTRHVTMDTHINKKQKITQKANTAVSDYLYNERNPKRKTADTEEILKRAGVPQEKIDILLGTNSKIPFVTKQISLSNVDDGKTNAFYNKKDKKIYITPRGASVMNGSSTNAIRIILHENIHRLFNSSKYTNAERQRIVTELEDVYNFVRQKFIEEHDNGKINDAFFNSVNKVLDTTQSYDNQQTRMEEFVVECLTQPLFTEWLNNTQYDNESSVQGIKQSKKSILQKLMDILLNLFGIKDRKINDFSILAREYVILGKGNNPTTNNDLFSQHLTTTSTAANTVDTDNTNSPVEGQPASPTAIDNQPPAINPATGENVETTTNDYIPIDEDGVFTMPDDEDYDPADGLKAATDLIENNDTTAEIYSVPIADGADISTFGVRTVNDMSDFVNTFPMQYRANIKQILASNELNYTCA
jgi:hypothetical protein